MSSPKHFSPEEEVYIERLVSYSLAFEKSAARLRQTCSPERIEVVHNRARAEWEDKANRYPSQCIPETRSTEWYTMWRKLQTILTSNPKSDRE